MCPLQLLNPAIKAHYSSNFKGAVAVIAAPFNSYPIGGLADRSNTMIATLVREFAVAFKLPAFVQREQAAFLDRARIPVYEYKTGTGDWVQTHVLIKWIAPLVHKHYGGSKVVLIGHPDHVRRIAILARYYGLEPVIPHACKEVPYDPRVRPGDQWWCRSRWKYLVLPPWEYIARAATVWLWALRKL